MRQAHTTLSVDTRCRGLQEITRRIADWVGASGIASGLLTVFVRHTSASLLIQENADPGVQRDLERFFARLAPDGIGDGKIFVTTLDDSIRIRTGETGEDAL